MYSLQQKLIELKKKKKTLRREIASKLKTNYRDRVVKLNRTF